MAFEIGQQIWLSPDITIWQNEQIGWIEDIREQENEEGPWYFVRWLYPNGREVYSWVKEVDLAAEQDYNPEM